MTSQTSNTPLVSIVLPTYNRASRLNDALESCLSQTYPNIEVVVVDDGSSDDTPQVLARWAERDSRVKVFRKKNGGLPKALNYGFERVQGQYLTWTSDDNAFLPEAIEQMVNRLEAEGKPALLYADFWAVYEDGQEKKHIAHEGPPDMQEKNVVGACFMYPKAIQEAVGLYDVDYFLAEDYEYWLRIQRQFPLIRLEKPLYLYRYHEEAYTSKRRYEVKAMTYVTRYKYGLTGLGQFLRHTRKTLSQLLRSPMPLGRRLAAFQHIVGRLTYLLWMKPNPL